MPNYDYECERCGVMEIWHKPDESKGRCPYCGGHLRRLWTKPGVKFNGSGFYSTDNANNANNKGGK